MKKLIIILIIASISLLLSQSHFGGGIVGNVQLNKSFIDSSFAWNPTGNPIGGFGYSDTISMAALSNNHTSSWVITGAGTPVDSAIIFLAAAGDSDTVYVHDTLELDFTGETTPIWINMGTTFCSGRNTTKAGTTSWGAKIYIEDWDGISNDYLFGMRDSSRFTGFRLRGTFDVTGGYILISDSVNTNPPGSEYAIRAWDDDYCEIDNNEFWGWGTAPFLCRETHGTTIHHNYIHHQCYVVYPGYGCSFDDGEDSCNVVVEANVWERSGFMIGGATCYDTRLTIRYNRFSPWCQSRSMYFHDGAPLSDTLATAEIYRNIFQKSSFGLAGTVTGIEGGGANDNKDTIRIRNNWIWKPDSQSSWAISPNLIRIYDNYYTPSQPVGFDGFYPSCSIWVNDTTHAVPFICSLSAYPSSDPDGNLTTVMIEWGDSLAPANYRRSGDYTDTLVYTFDEIGTYTILVKVIDDDGFVEWVTQTIDVTPTSGHYLSAWVHDHYNGNMAGYINKQIWINNTLWWEKDIAGFSLYEHVILDITDTIDLYSPGDSIDIRFQLKCVRDTTDYWSKFNVDDVAVYGATVVNGNFEDSARAYNQWTGVNSRTDGYWENVRNWTDTEYCVEGTAPTHGGILHYYMGKSQGAIAVGDSMYVKQRIEVD